MTALILILAVLAGLSNAIMDRTKTKSMWNSSIWSKLPEDNWWVKWAGPNAWLNKWKLDDNGKSTGKPRFFLSTTAFVFVTDAWHFFQMMWRNLMMVIIIIYGYFGMGDVNLWIIPNWIFDYIFISVAYLISFNVFYDHVFKKNNE